MSVTQEFRTFSNPKKANMRFLVNNYHTNLISHSLVQEQQHLLVANELILPKTIIE